jgi:multicomponent Na+:H+ antiporter subunit E
MTHRNPLRYLWLIYYIPIFLWECLKANIDVAFRALRPDLPIRPGTVRVKTGLKSDLGLTFLANSLTLTPGNTTIDVDRDAGVLYVHRLYIKGASSQPIPAAVRFESILEKVFD